MEIVCPAWHPGTDRLIDAIQLLTDQGVTAVEIQLFVPHYFDYSDAFEIQTLLATLRTFGIRIHSVHSPFGGDCDISSPEDHIHERGVEGILDSIELASLLDAEIVVVHASDKIENSNGRRMERARGVIREMAVVARESRTMLAIENLPPGYLGHTPKEIEELIDGTDRDSIGICFDSGHANLSGRFTEFAESLLPRAVSTHLHDNNGISDQHLFPGEGTIDWPAFGSLFRETGNAASVMLECAPPEGLIWSQAFQQFRTAMGD